MEGWPKTPRRLRALETRAAVIQALRDFFHCRGYLEVETPHRIPAPAPESHIDAVESGEWFLHPSPEICMKRLLAAGHPRIFQICRCWRARERGSRHLPEFTLLEWYRTGIDYRALMEECEDLFLFLGERLRGGRNLEYLGERVNLDKPWPRMSVRDAFDRFAPLPMAEAMEWDRFDETLVRHVEPNLGKGKPAFVFDYPAPLGALARLRRDDLSVAERFEIYLFGLEIANGFSELTDPQEQRKRFEKEMESRRHAGKTVYPMPEKFLSELSGMPESAGIALGVDRLAMIFSNAASIDEVSAFSPEDL